MGVYHKGGSNANDRTSVFDVNRDQVKNDGPERKRFPARVIFPILILSS